MAVLRFASAALRLLVLLAIIAGATVATVAAVSPQFSDIGQSITAEATDYEFRGLATRSKVYDRYGSEIQILKDDGTNRETVDLSEMAPAVVQAVVAIEDTTFYDHVGINLQSITRAAVENVGAGGISQGGSTITQQIAKNLIIDNEQSIFRKIKEAAYAVRIEQEYSKDELLELYLNTVYFGANAYGVKTAAEVYWGKQPQELNWGEAALLASLIRQPGANDPFVNPDEARRQRSIVLRRLAELDLISEEDSRFFSRTPLPTVRQTSVELPPEDYFADLVRQLVLGEAASVIDPQFQEFTAKNPEVLGATAEEREARVFGSGLRIFTTYDPEVQEMAEAAQREVLPDDVLDAGFTMALISVEPQTGAIPYMVGGNEYTEDNKYNIATGSAGRQPGSAFKTFVMITALEAGYTPLDSFDGRSPCRWPNVLEDDGFYDVQNYNGSLGGVATLQDLTTSSSNCGYVGIGQVVGIDNVVDVAQRLGVTGDIGSFMSLPLGTQEVAPLDMASAYATIANDGIRNDPYMIERIEDERGNVLYEHTQFSVRAIDSDVACWAMQVLAANVVGGTGRAAQLTDQPAGGKTGTTDKSGDAWFVGSTPKLTTAVWMGHPDGNETRMVGVGGLDAVTGGSFPAQAWGNFSERYHADLERADFDECPPYARSGRFVRGDGEFGSLLYCDGGQPYPVDINGDGQPDQCYGSTGGLYQCGTTGGFDQYGNPVAVYCIGGGAVGNGPGGGQQQAPQAGPAPRREQQLSDGSVIRCPDAYPFGYDTNGDGIIDECRN